MRIKRIEWWVVRGWKGEKEMQEGRDKMTQFPCRAYLFSPSTANDYRCRSWLSSMQDDRTFLAFFDTGRQDVPFLHLIHSFSHRETMTSLHTSSFFLKRTVSTVDCLWLYISLDSWWDLWSSRGKRSDVSLHGSNEWKERICILTCRIHVFIWKDCIMSGEINEYTWKKRGWWRSQGV